MRNTSHKIHICAPLQMSSRVQKNREPRSRFLGESILITGPVRDDFVLIELVYLRY